MSDRNFAAEQLLNAKTWDEAYEAIYYLIRENDILRDHCDELKRIIGDHLAAPSPYLDKNGDQRDE